MAARLDEIFAPLSAALPEFSETEQHLAIELYRLLARGEPVRRELLAEALGLPTREVVALLDEGGLKSLVYHDDSKRIIGFGGLAVAPMTHRFVVDGRTLYTWCAWDALFIPEILGITADVESTCPETRATIRLTVTADGVESVEPAEAVMSFLLPDAPLFENTTAATIASFCHYIYFLASPKDGAEWITQHDGTFLLPLDDAFQLGRLNNAARFGAVLGTGSLGTVLSDGALARVGNR